jgi:hypothetical protein
VTRDESTTKPDPEGDTRWVLALYGGTMLAIQGLENTVSWLYLLTDIVQHGGSSGDARRQWLKAFQRSWSAFQRGAPREKLNDAKRGIKDQLDPELYADLDSFLAGPRAQLAHRYLVERLRPPDGSLPTPDLLATLRFQPGTVLELLQVTMQANELTRRLFERADEMRAALPEAPGAPDEIKEFVELIVRATMFKQFPEPMLGAESDAADGTTRP